MKAPKESQRGAASQPMAASFERAATPCDPTMVAALSRAVKTAGFSVYELPERRRA